MMTPKPSGMRILIAGGRDFRNHKEGFRILDKFLNWFSDIDTVIFRPGDGIGALASSWASKHELYHIVFPSLWHKYSENADRVCNKNMLDARPDIVVAFPGGAGEVEELVGMAQNRGITTYQVTANVIDDHHAHPPLSCI